MGRAHNLLATFLHGACVRPPSAEAGDLYAPRRVTVQ